MSRSSKCKLCANSSLKLLPSRVQTCVGHNIHIPMPGHTIGDSMKQQTLDSIANIEKLVEEHDVIFLLTDSRESRWLPTMLGAVKDKVYLILF